MFRHYADMDYKHYFMLGMLIECTRRSEIQRSKIMHPLNFVRETAFKSKTVNEHCVLPNPSVCCLLVLQNKTIQKIFSLDIWVKTKTYTSIINVRSTNKPWVFKLSSLSIFWRENCYVYHYYYYVQIWLELSWYKNSMSRKEKKL